MKQLFLCKAGGNSLFPLLHAFIKITKIKPKQFNLKHYLNTKTLLNVKLHLYQSYFMFDQSYFLQNISCQSISVVYGQRGEGEHID